MPDTSTGSLGEDYVTAVLIEKGYRLVARNFHSRYGEIDIIVRDDRYIVFVEVKTRKVKSLTSPFEAVTKSKQQKIIKTAEFFLMRNKFNLQPRFDVAAVETREKEVISLNYLTDAFRVN
ncbi:MAG: YraN family protein [Clostridia bacterium]|nr:YraN family protein [Clostridia bacterium]